MAQRRAIAKAITLLESTRADHRAQADALLVEARAKVEIEVTAVLPD